MIDELRALAVFAKTVETGSFRRAAAELKLSPSVVSHHVSRLEERLGCSLLYRSTRKLSLTDQGQRLYQQAAQMVAAAEQGLELFSSGATQPVGRLRLSLPALLANSPVVGWLAEFREQYPGVEVEASFTDRKQDLIAEGIDLAIRIGELQDSSLRQRRLWRMTRTLVASPVLAAKFNMPDQPDDLAAWPWIGISIRPDYKLFLRDGREEKVEYQPQLSVDNIEVATRLSVAGAGLATPPDFMAAPFISRGELVELLPQWQVEPLDVFALWPEHLSAHSLSALFVRFLLERLPF